MHIPNVVNFKKVAAFQCVWQTESCSFLEFSVVAEFGRIALELLKRGAGTKIYEGAASKDLNDHYTPFTRHFSCQLFLTVTNSTVMCNKPTSVFKWQNGGRNVCSGAPTKVIIWHLWWSVLFTSLKSAPGFWQTQPSICT